MSAPTAVALGCSPTAPPYIPAAGSVTEVLVPRMASGAARLPCNWRVVILDCTSREVSICTEDHLGIRSSVEANSCSGPGSAESTSRTALLWLGLRYPGRWVRTVSIPRPSKAPGPGSPMILRAENRTRHKDQRRPRYPRTESFWHIAADHGQRPNCRCRCRR